MTTRAEVTVPAGVYPLVIETYAYRGESEYSVLLQELIMVTVGASEGKTLSYLDKIVNKLLG